MGEGAQAQLEQGSLSHPLAREQEVLELRGQRVDELALGVHELEEQRVAEVAVRILGEPFRARLEP